MPSPGRSIIAGIRWGLALCLVSGMGVAAELGLGVVYPTDGEQIYASDPAGFVHAVNLQHGQTRWVSADRALPLALHQERLIALASVGQFGLGMLLLIDPASGQVLDRIAFDLPENVSAELPGKPHRRFRMTAEDRPQGLRLHWRYAARALRGAQMDQPGDDAGANDGSVAASGALDLLQDTQGMRLLPLQGDAVPVIPSTDPELASSARLPGLAGRQFRSGADLAVLHSVERADPVIGLTYTWELLQPNGSRLGSLRSPFAYAPFEVQDGVLVYRASAHGQTDGRGVWTESPPQLIAWDLRRARELWRFDVLDAEYRGPLPP